ncbi:hypothetical protein BDZ97DRAFT_1916044 [Flammula alnicola]|nr:hypothetical protein BDZ97DRAFT_1916044 [Flammula alnicola]
MLGSTGRIQLLLTTDTINQPLQATDCYGKGKAATRDYGTVLGATVEYLKGRSDALRDTQAAQKAKVDAAVTNADTLQSRVSEDTSNEKAPEAPSSSKTATGNLKKVTKSNAPKNLCYKAYLDNHEPITPAAFEVFYKALPKDEIKHWNELSKSKKGRTVEDHADDG